MTIKQARKSLGKTQDEFVSMLNTISHHKWCRENLSKIERGRLVMNEWEREDLITLFSYMIGEHVRKVNILYEQDKDVINILLQELDEIDYYIRSSDKTRVSRVIRDIKQKYKERIL